MKSSDETLKAVEALCEILEDLVLAPGTCSPQALMISYRLKRLRAGCEAIREGKDTGEAREILDRGKKSS